MKSKKGPADPEESAENPAEEASESPQEEAAEAEPMKSKVKAKKPFGKK